MPGMKRSRLHLQAHSTKVNNHRVDLGMTPGLYSRLLSIFPSLCAAVELKCPLLALSAQAAIGPSLAGGYALRVLALLGCPARARLECAPPVA
jgi:hypothetical protein